MPIAAAITGAATLGGGLLSSIFGKKSNDSANQTNLKIAQMNNEWSEKMMEKQNQMNIAQWEREAAYNDRVRAETNEYNSAVNQAARLREAGINPALAMSGANAGTSQGGSAPSGNSVGQPSPSSAQVLPYDYSGISRAITDAAMSVLQVQKQQAEVTNMNLNNEYLYKSMQSRLAQDFEKGRAQKYDTDFRQMNESTRIAIENEQYLSAVTNRLMANQQRNLVKQQTIYQRLVNKNLPDKLAMEISVMASQRDLNTFNSSINVGKFMDEIKKRGIKLSNTMEKVIFGTLLAMSALKR